MVVRTFKGFKMFSKGQAVKPAGSREDLKFFMLDSERVYHVEEFNTAEECLVRWPDRPHFHKNGGRIVVSELPKLEWFGTRFIPVD